jgi:hypothetical protein
MKLYFMDQAIALCEYYDVRDGVSGCIIAIHKHEELLLLLYTTYD